MSHTRQVEGAPILSAASIYPYDEQWMINSGEHCSMTERRADEATRDVVNWLKCEYLLSRVGDEYEGVVVSVTGFGLFVQLTELFIEGLVHITGLPKDYYYHEAAHHRLVGERTKRVFRLGDKLRVRVSRVALDERKIDFDLVEEGKKGRKATSAGPKAAALAAEHEQSARKRGKTGKPRSDKSAAKTDKAGNQQKPRRRKPPVAKR